MCTPARAPRRRILLATAIAAVTLASACGSPQPEVVGSVRVTAQSGTDRSAQLTYDFGDSAYAPPGLDGKRVELKASVTYPRELAGGKHPLVMLLHGWGDTCAVGDKPVRGKGWPCAGEAKPVDNFLGYGYLAEALAERGYIVVSVAANGIQAQEKTGGHTARAALLDKHLEMWERLSGGEGPLRELEQFTGHVDLDRVGTLGHSRGGGGVLAQALDGHELPPGVHLRGTLAFAPALNGIKTDKERITRVPLSLVAGTCDAMWEDSKVPVAMAAGNPDVEHHDVPGGNHNFFNTVWTPGTGPAFATDDVAVEKRNRPGGRCESTNGAGAVPQLGPAEQREAAIRYATAFFDKHLK
ncbi:alpha/beta hydrolase family protein [Streptomyces sp. IBSNAI002]|uniref:alpha/beta hydrolase family protein n=1 Tax=Streptomyces sp. IBSNAI002 TaxID=3457500 RepID=UPI003FD22ED0